MSLPFVVSLSNPFVVSLSNHVWASWSQTRTGAVNRRLERLRQLLDGRPLPLAWAFRLGLETRAQRLSQPLDPRGFGDQRLQGGGLVAQAVERKRLCLVDDALHLVGLGPDRQGHVGGAAGRRGLLLHRG